jgi:hypothetical protein
VRYENPAWMELHRRGNLVGQALTGLMTMPANELVALRHACAQVTTTNCGWDAYLIAPLLKKEIDTEFYRRRMARKRATPPAEVK